MGPLSNLIVFFGSLWITLKGFFASFASGKKFDKNVLLPTSKRPVIRVVRCDDFPPRGVFNVPSSIPQSPHVQLVQIPRFDRF